MAIDIARQLDDRVMSRMIEHNISEELCHWYSAKTLP